MLKVPWEGACSRNESLGKAGANVPVTASLSDTGKAMGAGWFSSITVTGTFIDNEIQGGNSS